MSNSYETFLTQLDVGFGVSSVPSTDTADPRKSIILTGTNPDIDTGTVPEDIIDQGGVLTFLTSADTIDVVSTDANDAIGGTGAQIVLIEGLDANYDQQWEVVYLAGLTPVTTTKSYLRVNVSRVVFSGSGMTNAGAISLTDTTTGLVTVSYMVAGDSFSKDLVFTVPRDYEFFISNTEFTLSRSSATGNATVSSRVFVPSTNTIVSGVDFEIGTSKSRTTSAPLHAYARVPEKSDLWYRVVNVSANNTVVNGTVRGWLVHSSKVPNFTKII